ncbi:MAG: hypothetical protein ACXIVE_16480 [Salinarimonas sp.]
MSSHKKPHGIDDSFNNTAVDSFNAKNSNNAYDNQSENEYYNDSFNNNSTNTNVNQNQAVDNSLKADVDVDIEDSFNDQSTTNTANGSFNDNSNNSDNSQYFALGFDLDHEEINHSFNSKEFAVDDHSVNDSFNDSSDNSSTVKMKDAYNDKSDNSTTNVLHDAHNDKSVADSFNDQSTNSIDVALQDMWNDKSSTANNSFNEIDQSTNTHDSFNHDTEIDIGVDIADSFNHSADSLVDGMIAVENSAFDAISAIKDALKGDGMNLAFSVNQISEIMDNDKLYHPVVNSNADWGQHAHANGGEAIGIYAKKGFEVESGEDMAFQAIGDADAVVSQEAFNLSIAMGNNIQFNAVDMSVVGGNSSMTAGDDLAA